MSDPARRPRVIVDTHFRPLADVFSSGDLERLHELADVVWAKDEPMPTDRFMAEVPDADAVIFGRWRHGPHAWDVTDGRLVALLEVAGGHEHPELGYDRALDRGVRVGSCAPAFAPVVAEFGLGLALTLVRGIASADAAMRRGDETWLHEGNQRNTSLFGATIGFVGCGGIATQLATLLQPFGSTLLGYDPPLPANELADRGFTPTDLPELFDRSDLVFVLAAPTASTNGLISRELLERLGAHQSVVILSRASVVDMDALLECATANRFRFATDVYPIEPVPADDPIRTHPQALLTPHLAGAFDQALHSVGQMVVDDLEAIFAGGAGHRMQYLTRSNREGLVQAPKASGWAEHLRDG